MKSKEAVTILKEEKLYLSNNNANEVINTIEKELQKPQQLYNKIKEKRANARLNYNYHCFKDKELKGQIAAYNDVLSLMESMFEGLKEDKVEVMKLENDIKKIKNLTDEEIKNICKKNRENCQKCPLVILQLGNHICCLLTAELAKTPEKEIEVENEN